MSSIAAAVVGGAVISGAMASSASKKAAKTQAASADRSADLQQEQFDKQVELQAPFREAGLTSQNRLMEMLGIGGTPTSPDYGKYAGDFTMSDYYANKDPGYGFRLGEGIKGLNATAAARGGLISGNALRAATAYGQDMGSQEYQNAYNRYQINRSNQLTPLQSLMGAGQTATNTMGQAGQNYANQAGEAYMGAGNARASGYVGSANAWSNALGGANNALNQYGAQQAYNARTNAMYGGGMGGGASIFTPNANYLAPTGGGNLIG